MSLDLVDFRGRITPETDCVLEAVSLLTGQDKQAVLRGVMDRWARAQIDGASVLQRKLAGKGLIREGEGAPRGRRATDYAPALFEAAFDGGLKACGE